MVKRFGTKFLIRHRLAFLGATLLCSSMGLLPAERRPAARSRLVRWHWRRLTVTGESGDRVENTWRLFRRLVAPISIVSIIHRRSNTTTDQLINWLKVCIRQSFVTASLASMLPSWQQPERYVLFSFTDSATFYREFAERDYFYSGLSPPTVVPDCYEIGPLCVCVCVCVRSQQDYLLCKSNKLISCV